ncbi:hypothetical protein HDU98_004173 [Podochytrium sp. JEL0797]|nr:hypothetical protein HDU98_004173 [Podochytrium sp. JEL0797]
MLADDPQPPSFPLPQVLYIGAPMETSGTLTTHIFSHPNATTPYLMSTATAETNSFTIETADSEPLYQFDHQFFPATASILVHGEYPVDVSRFKITGGQGPTRTPVSPSPAIPGVVKMADRRVSFRNPFQAANLKFTWTQASETLFRLEKHESSTFGKKPVFQVAELEISADVGESAASEKEKLRVQIHAELRSLGGVPGWNSYEECAFIVGTCVAAGLCKFEVSTPQSRTGESQGTLMVVVALASCSIM